MLREDESYIILVVRWTVRAQPKMDYTYFLKVISWLLEWDEPFIMDSMNFPC